MEVYHAQTASILDVLGGQVFWESDLSGAGYASDVDVAQAVMGLYAEFMPMAAEVGTGKDAGGRGTVRRRGLKHC